MLSEPPRHNASHGLARYAPWTVVEHGDSHVVCSLHGPHRSRGGPGILEARLTYRLTEDGLHVTLEATNAGAVNVPFGYGAHPYLTVGEGAVDEVQRDAARGQPRLEVDDRMLPVAAGSPVDGTGLDLRDGAPVGDRAARHRVHRPRPATPTAAGRPTLERGDRYAALWADASFGWAQVFTGREAARRGAGRGAHDVRPGRVQRGPDPRGDAGPEPEAKPCRSGGVSEVDRRAMRQVAR